MNEEASGGAYITVSQQLLDRSSTGDLDRYLMATLAQEYGMELDHEVAEWLALMNWRPLPLLPTRRQKLRARFNAARTAVAYRIAPWLPREEEWA